MGIGELTKELIRKYPITCFSFYLLIGMNSTTYYSTKYMRLNHCQKPKIEAQQVLKEYDNYHLAKPFVWGSYKAAQEVLQK